jgi:SAM-dependent methyltransferase
MCTSCQLPDFESATSDAFGERILDIINSGALSLMISIGHRTGLFDTMKILPPSTSEQIARAAGLSERYVREWLGAMVVGHIVRYIPESKTYSLPQPHADCLTRDAAPNNLAAFTQYISVLASVETRIVECFEKGGGVSYAEYPRFQRVMAEDSAQSVLSALYDYILPLVPGLIDHLEKGIHVLDVGCGSGLALQSLAERFPRSRFKGYEIDNACVLEANARVAAKRLTNVEFKVQDAATFSDTGRFDLIFTFDAVHDQASPDRLLENIHRALKPGGVYLMQDIDAQSNVDGNMKVPMAPLLYTVSCMHCMTVSLAVGGQGLGAMWGEGVARRMLKRAGFGEIEIHRLPHDVMNAYYVLRK